MSLTSANRVKRAFLAQLALVAQWIERFVQKKKVVGSTPTQGTIMSLAPDSLLSGRARNPAVFLYIFGLKILRCALHRTCVRLVYATQFLTKTALSAKAMNIGEVNIVMCNL